jgi:hypothetical protein
MARLTWLAHALRDAGLRVVEVPGWETRGSIEFDPVGVTWHATAGSRRGTAQGEVNVILNGSETAPPPIAQLMLWRDGTFYVCAAGRCNHNKVGWAGPNEGLGNTKLLGIEMANDNRGEPWPDVQLDAVRRATAVIMARLGADPMRRLAAHYEHQPAAGRPPGETSTKTDPYGVVMDDERPRVAAIMRGEDGVSKQNVIDALASDEGAEALAHSIKTTPALREALAWAVLAYDPGADKDGDTPNGAVVNMTNPKPGNETVGPATALERAQVAAVVGYQIRDRVDALTALVRSLAELAATEAGEDDAEMVELRARLDAALAAVKAVPGLTVGALGGAGQSDAEVAAALRAALGDRARPVGQLLAA